MRSRSDTIISCEAARGYTIKRGNILVLHALFEVVSDRVCRLPATPRLATAKEGGVLDRSPIRKKSALCAAVICSDPGGALS